MAVIVVVVHLPRVLVFKPVVQGSEAPLDALRPLAALGLQLGDVEDARAADGVISAPMPGLVVVTVVARSAVDVGDDPQRIGHKIGNVGRPHGADVFEVQNHVVFVAPEIELAL